MQVIRIISYVLKVQIRNTLMSVEDLSANVAYGLFLTYIYFTGMHLSYLLSSLNASGISLMESDLFTGLYIIILSLTILKEFFPAYIHKKSVLPVYHPLSTGKEFILTGIFNLFTKSNGAIQLFIVSATLTHSGQGPIRFLIGELFFLAGISIVSSLKTMIESHVRGKLTGIFLNGLAYIILSFLALTGSGRGTMLVLPSAFIVVILWTINYRIERGIPEMYHPQTAYHHRPEIIHGPGIWSVLFKGRKFSILLATGLVIKIISLSFIILLAISFDDEWWTGDYLVMSIFLSPFITFMSLMNMYGLNDNLWLNIELAGGGYQAHLQIFRKFFLTLIAIDALITIPTFVIAGFLFIPAIIFYLTSCVVFYFVSFMFSCYLPKKVNKVHFSLARPVSLWAQLTPAIPIILMLPLVSNWFYIFNMFIVIISWLVYKYLLYDPIFSGSKYRLYTKLFYK